MPGSNLQLCKPGGGNMEVIIASGYFNPLHVGHLDYLKRAKKLGDWLIVIVNNDNQVELKGSKPFMKEKDRLEIVKNLSFVDEAVLSKDDDRSVSETLQLIHRKLCYNNFTFANGGDVTSDSCREKETCSKLKIKLVDGLGEKIRSSSKLKDE